MNEKKPFKPGEQKQPKYEPEIKHIDQDFNIKHGNYEKKEKYDRIIRPIRNPKGEDD